MFFQNFIKVIEWVNKSKESRICILKEVIIIQHFCKSLLYDFVDITTFKQLSLKFFQLLLKK
jgi:hypothetical protein